MTDRDRTAREHSHEHRQADCSPGAGAPGEETLPVDDAVPAAAGADGGETSGTRPGDGRAHEPHARAAVDHNGDAAEVVGDLDELVKTAAERDEYLALAQRTQADFENY